MDQALYISLAGMEAFDLTPKNITAFMVGLQSKIAIFHVQRQVNNYPKEPLMAILPGIALTELWQMMRAIGVSPFFVLMTIQVEALLISLAGIIIAILALAIGILFC